MACGSSVTSGPPIGTSSIGKSTRLRAITAEHGPGNGKILILPIDQGLEHGPRDFSDNPESANPEYQLRLALEGGFSGIAFHIGLAEKYMAEFAGRVPLVLKLNGKTEIPSEEESFSPLISTVEDAARLGAVAVGYTVYVGSPAQGQDFTQFRRVRQEAERYGMPIIVWAYPRGRAIEERGGRNSLYAIDYAARVALELGADIVKINFPVYDPERAKFYPKPYDELRLSEAEMLKKVIDSAGRAMVIMSGGPIQDETALLEKVRLAVEAGAAGFIFGRNMWGRPFNEALSLANSIKDILHNTKTKGDREE